MKADMKAAVGVGEVCFTLLRRDGGRPIGKIIRRDAGRAVKVPAGDLSRGTAETICAPIGRAAAALAEAIESAGADTLAVLGHLPGRPASVEIATALRAQPPETFARTEEHFGYRAGEPAWMLFDHDTKWQTPEIAEAVAQAGGPWGAIASVAPGLLTAARVRRGSSSAAVVDDLGLPVFPAGSQHTFVLVRDAGDIARAARVLDARTRLAGFGGGAVSAAGSFLLRGIVDLATARGSQPVFIGPPTINAKGLALDNAVLRPEAQEGEAVDTLAAVPDLTPEEEAANAELMRREKRRLAPEMQEKAASADRRYRVRMLAAGVSESEIRRALAARRRGVLVAGFPLSFDGVEGDVLAGEVLHEPDRWHGKTLADPFEPEEGANRAICYTDRRQAPRILSQLHGGMRYRIAVDPAEVEKEERAEAAALLRDFRSAPADSPEGRAAMRAMNVLHRVVKVGANTLVADLAPEANGDKVLPRLARAEAFRMDYENRTLLPSVDGAKGKLPKPIPLTDAWRASRARAEASRLVFCPTGEEPEGTLNAYAGPAVVPRRGKWDRLRDLIENVICSGDAEHSRYLLDLLAYKAQNPFDKPGIAVVLRGGEGVGKGVFANAFASLFGVHAVRMEKERQVVGNFNAHLAGRLVAIADEAMFAGNPAARGALKALITEPTMLVEPKGVDAFEIAAPVMLFILTNERWAVPAAGDARRFFVLEVPTTRQQQGAYFAAIAAELDNGGREAFLHDLLAREVRRADIARVPQTEALAEQRALSLEPWERWWVDVLAQAAGRDEVKDGGTGFQPSRAWPRSVEKGALYDHYAATQPPGRALPRQVFGRRLRELCPSAVEHRPRGVGAAKRPECYRLPAWEEAARLAERKTGVRIVEDRSP